MSRAQANLLLLAVALIWGSAFVAQAQAMDGVEPLTFTGVRFMLGVCIVAPLAWRDWRLISRRQGRPQRCDMLGVLALGLLLTLSAVFQQIGITGRTVTNAGFLTALYVPLVPLLSCLIMRARPHWSVWPTINAKKASTGFLAEAGEFLLTRRVGSESGLFRGRTGRAGRYPW